MRVALRCDDLLFASRLKAALEAAGHEVELQPVAATGAARAGSEQPFDAVVVDLERLVEGATLDGRSPVLGFYPHLRRDLPQRAAQLGVDRAVPRSRAAREIVQLVEGLVQSGER